MNKATTIYPVFVTLPSELVINVNHISALDFDDDVEPTKYYLFLAGVGDPVDITEEDYRCLMGLIEDGE